MHTLLILSRFARDYQALIEAAGPPELTIASTNGTNFRADSRGTTSAAAVVGSVRAEYEYDVPLSDAREILQKLCVGTLEKTRHYVEHAGMVWEIDEFSGANTGL